MNETKPEKMVRRSVAIALGLICIILAVSLDVVAFMDHSSPQTGRVMPVKVGVYYYLWYGNSDGSGGLHSPHWNDSEGNIVVDRPVDGFYSSSNSSEIHKQLKEMISIGINFLVASWWGPNNAQNLNHGYIDSNIRLMFNIINSDNLLIQTAIMIEPFNKSGSYNFSYLYNYVYDTFVKPYGNIYMKLGNKHLVLFYNDQNLTPNGIIETDGRFDSIISGHQNYVDWVYWSFPEQQLHIKQPQPWNASTQPVCVDGEIDVCPRYDDSYQRYPNETFDANYSKDYYGVEWDNAIAGVGNGSVQIVMISTWNEYHERTQIEPCYDKTSVYTNDPYHVYNETAKYIANLQAPPKSPNPPVWLPIGTGVLGGIIASGIVTFYFLKLRKKTTMRA